jgi:hypothetical protein
MKPSIIVIEGKYYRWRDILQLRREQLAATAQASNWRCLPTFPPTAARCMSARLQAGIYSRVYFRFYGTTKERKPNHARPDSTPRRIAF